MNLIAKLLLKTFILCNLLLSAICSNSDLPHVEIDNLLLPNNFVHTGNLSDLVDNVEYGNNNISLHNWQNLTFTNVYSNPATSSESQFVDLDYDYQNQSTDNIFTIPEHLPEEQRLSSEIITDNIKYQPSKKHRRIFGRNQSSSPKESAFGYANEFTHNSSKLFLNSKRFFKIEEYRAIFKYYYKCRSFFIDEFCDKDQVKSLQSIGIYWPEKLGERNFARLEIYIRRMIFENMITKKSVDQSLMYEYQTVNKILDPERTKGLFYLLIYSFYETGVIGLPRSNSAVEKILFNIITHTRLMAYINNDNIRKTIQFKSTVSVTENGRKMSKRQQKVFSRYNFRYTDFTKIFVGGSFPKKDMFLSNAEKIKKEISDNIQLIIDQEFGDNPEYKRLCEDYNSKVVKFNKHILFERFSFRIGEDATDNYLCKDVDHNNIICANGYPMDILSCLMDAETKKQIKDLSEIRLKSVFILIFISKIFLCNVTDLCTLPEYLILIESLQKAYLKHKKAEVASDDFQSLLSYFFSLDYLDEDCGSSENYRERARRIISAVFPEYNVIFPDFDSEIDKLFEFPFILTLSSFQ